MTDTQRDNAAIVELEIPNFFDNCHIKSIGNTQVPIYCNSKNNYFYTPLILVDWLKFKDNLDGVEKKSGVCSIFLPISFINEKIESDIRVFLKNKGANVFSLSVLPYTFFKIIVDIGKNSIVINKNNIPISSDGISLTKRTNISYLENYEVSAKYSELIDFYNLRKKSGLIRGFLYSDGFTYTSGYIKALASFLSDSSTRIDLIGDESMVNKTIVNSSTSSQGLSLSFPGGSFGGGGGGDKISSEKIKQRLLNRNYVADFFTKNREKLSIEAAVPVEQVRYIMDSLVGRLFDIGTKISVEFQKNQDNDYEIIKNEMGYSKIGKLSAKDILAGKPSFEKTDGNKINVKIGGIEVGVDKNNSIKNSDDITWSYDGEDLLPTKVDMVLLSDVKLSGEFEFSSLIIGKDGNRSTVTEFIYPSAWLADDSNVVDGSNRDVYGPVGSIVAFAGTRSSCPAGWFFCHGQALDVDKYVRLFEIVGFRWGGSKEENKFLLPDFQGLFLRGADYTGKYDPDVGSRSNKIGENGEVGSYQDDALQDIRGRVTGVKADNNKFYAEGAFAIGPHNGDGDGGENRPCFDIDFNASRVARTSRETRPKNMYVNWIIRAI